MVEGLRGQSYSRPLTAMREYLDGMDASIYVAPEPPEPPRRVLAALGPKMLALAAERADGAHPYNVPPEHTAQAREILGADKLLAPEQAVVLETDPAEARRIGREHFAIYVDLPNYMNNLRRFGITDDDLVDGGSDRLVDTVVAWGDVEAIRARVQAHHDAGADHVAVQVLKPSRADVPMDEWRELAPGCSRVRVVPEFETYNERVADGLVRAHEKDEGLPGYLGIRLTETWPGGMRAEIAVRADLLNQFGNLHGGVLAALCDHVLGTVCYPVIPPGAWAATTEFKLNYLAPVTGGTLSVSAQIASLTKRTAVVRIEVDNDGRQVCLAQGTVLIMPPKT